jgi:hypothetical protein
VVTPRDVAEVPFLPAEQADLENKNAVFHADDRPYGTSKGTVRGDDARKPRSGRFDPDSGPAG